jgi:hypothetical protein
LVKLIEYCFDHQIFVKLKLSRKYIIFIFLAAVVNQSSHLTSISDHFSYVTLKNLMIKRGTYMSLLEIWLVEKVGYILTSLSYKNSDENCMNMYYIYKICNLTFNSHKYLTKYDDSFLQLHVFVCFVLFVCFCLFFVLFFRFYFYYCWLIYFCY